MTVQDTEEQTLARNSHRLYTFCAVGKRSLTAGNILEEFGYEARPLKPGCKELIRAGFKRAKIVNCEKYIANLLVINTDRFNPRACDCRRTTNYGVGELHCGQFCQLGFQRGDLLRKRRANHGREAKRFDQPVAALLKDLKRSGMLDETLVICTSEFGRMCCSQGGKGRDHNPFAFTSWLAGGGIKGGTAYGESDEFAYKTVQDPVYLRWTPTVGQILGWNKMQATRQPLPKAGAVAGAYKELVYV